MTEQLRDTIYFSNKRNFFSLTKKIPSQTKPKLKQQNQNKNENKNENKPQERKMKNQNQNQNKQDGYSMLPGKDQPQMELLRHSLSFSGSHELLL